jgi:hypothetical protein
MPRGDAGALAPKAAEKLAKIAGLLASDQPGEVVAAAAAGTRSLRAAGLTWQDALAPGALAAPPPRAAPRTKRRTKSKSAPAGDWINDVAACQARPDLMTAWERQFLLSLTGFTTLSPKQAAVLARLRERVRVAGGAL